MVEATSLTVGRNVLRLRTEGGLTLRELSARMPEDHPLRLTAIGEIERGERRVTVDDLTALAVALAVSPMALLVPLTKHADQPEVTVTGWPTTQPVALLRWLLGFRDTTGEDQTRVNLPPWAWGWRLDDERTT